MFVSFSRRILLVDCLVVWRRSVATLAAGRFSAVAEM
jgi:hypothetical protein